MDNTSTAFDELVTSLVDGGMSPGQAAALVARAVIEAVGQSADFRGSTVDNVTERRRAFDRKRKADQRKAVADQQKMSAECPRKSAEVRGNAPAILSSLTSSFFESPTEEKKERSTDVLSTEPRARQKRGARLTDDWEPAEADRQYAASRGLRPADIDTEAVKFRNYWTNRTDKQAAKPRWDRAWVNWILNIKGSGHSNGTAPRPGSKDDTRERTVNALRSLDPFPYADDAARGESTGPPLSRQLPLAKPPRS
jgi:hypothetical protein